MADKPALVSFVEEMEATLIEIINSISDEILRSQMVPNGDGKIKKKKIILFAKSLNYWIFIIVFIPNANKFFFI